MPDTIGDQSTPRVGLFVTCLVDAMRPQIGFAAIQLLEEAGCVVEVPRGSDLLRPAGLQQRRHRAARRPCPAGHRGFRDLRLCRGAVGLLRRDDPPALPGGAGRRSELGGRAPGARRPRPTRSRASWSMSGAIGPKGGRFAATATYHDSCAGLRELGVLAQPRKLLAAVDGLEMTTAGGQ